MSSVTIVGVGAIGGWLAWLLDRAGWDVRLLARGAALAAIREHGLRIEVGGGLSAHRLRASDTPADLGPSDYVILATKGHQLPPAAASLTRLIGPDTAVVTAMNGLQWWFTDGLDGPLGGALLESVDPGGGLRVLWPVERVIGCVVHASAAAVEPGLIRIEGTDQLIFGEPSGQSTERVGRLATATQQGGVTTEVSPNIRLAIWRKLWGNMSMNPVGALSRASTRAVLDDPRTRDVVRAMMLEMAALGARLGLDIGMTVEERMAVTRRLGDFKTSMQRDREANQKLELEPILGVLVEIADRLAEPVPHLRTVHALAGRLNASLGT